MDVVCALGCNKFCLKIRKKKFFRYNGLIISYGVKKLP